MIILFLLFQHCPIPKKKLPTFITNVSIPILHKDEIMNTYDNFQANCHGNGNKNQLAKLTHIKKVFYFSIISYICALLNVAWEHHTVRLMVTMTTHLMWRGYSYCCYTAVFPQPVFKYLKCRHLNNENIILKGPVPVSLSFCFNEYAVCEKDWLCYYKGLILIASLQSGFCYHYSILGHWLSK